MRLNVKLNELVITPSQVQATTAVRIWRRRKLEPENLLERSILSSRAPASLDVRDVCFQGCGCVAAAMASNPFNDDVPMASPVPPPLPPDDEPKYGGFTRFEMELEVCFVLAFLAFLACARPRAFCPAPRHPSRRPANSRGMIVRAVTRKPLLPQPPCFSETPRPVSYTHLTLPTKA